MRANYLHIEEQARSVLSEGVAGHFAEFGVWHGTTFIPLAELCRRNHRTVYAVDSFNGMGNPTDRDEGQYPKGSLSTQGSSIFRMLCKPFQNVVIFEGFVPRILNTIPDSKFAFVHLDLDHYQPTLDCLRWLWPKMSQGGVIACHDWFEERNSLAAGAIKDWCSQENVEPSSTCVDSHHCFFTKLEG